MLIKQKCKFIGLLLMLCVVGCDSQQAETSSLYPVLDSGMTASTDGGDKIYWMDNDRVIFVSYGPKPKTVEEQRQRKPAIYIWDTRENKIEKYADGRQLCYHEAYIRYAGPDRLPVPNTKYFVPPLYEGPMGKEKITNAHVFEEGMRKTKSGPKYQHNPYTCKTVERPAVMDGKVWLPLLEQHGALDWETDTVQGASESEQPIMYRRTSDDKAIALNITRGDLGLGNPRYYIKYRNEYFFQKLVVGKAEERDCDNYWWMTPTGEVTKGCLPIAPLNKLTGGRVMFPTAAGILISTGRLNDSDAGTAGLYLINENKAQRVLNGGHGKPSLSPNGCNLAFKHTPFLLAQRVGSPGESKLKIINLCSSGVNENE